MCMSLHYMHVFTLCACHYMYMHVVTMSTVWIMEGGGSVSDAHDYYYFLPFPLLSLWKAGTKLLPHAHVLQKLGKVMVVSVGM